jgi:hypothetical protein
MYSSEVHRLENALTRALVPRDRKVPAVLAWIESRALTSRQRVTQWPATLNLLGQTGTPRFDQLCNSLW